MADSTGTDLLGFGLSYYLNQQARNDAKNAANRPPTFYQAPLSPTDQWNALFKQQGLPYVRGYAQQFLQGLNGINPSNFHFNAPQFQGQPFAGGIGMPSIDFSKLPNLPSGAGTIPGALGTANSTGTPPPTNYDKNGNPQENSMPNLSGANLGGNARTMRTQEGGTGNDDTIYGAMTNQGASGYDINAALPADQKTPQEIWQTSPGWHPSPPGSTPPGQKPGIVTWGEQFIRDHPSAWMVLKTIAGAGAGLPGALTVTAAQWLYNHYGPGSSQPLPTNPTPLPTGPGVKP